MVMSAMRLPSVHGYVVTKFARTSLPSPFRLEDWLRKVTGYGLLTSSVRRDHVLNVAVTSSSTSTGCC